MKRKVAALFLVFALAIFATACGNSKKEETSEPANKEESVDAPDEPEQSQVVEEPTDLTGIWKSEANEGSWMEATISADTISVDWVSDEGNTRSIYWVGTYTAPTEYVEKYTWTSERNKEQTDSALMTSTDDTKEFSYSSEKLSYSVSLMGTTTQMELSKE